MTAKPRRISKRWITKTLEYFREFLDETDAPVDYQELAAMPVHVQVTLQEVARVKGISVEEIAAETTQNAKECFGLGDLES